MRKEKKIFVFGNTEYTLVKAQRWYIEYYIQHPYNVRERKRVYGYLNKISDLQVREEKAKAIALQLSTNTYDSTHPIKKNHAILSTLEKHKPLLRYKTYFTYKSRVAFFYNWLELTGKSELLITKDDANEFILYALQHRNSNTVKHYKQALISLYNKLSDDFNPFAKAITPRVAPQSLYFFIDVQIKEISCYMKENTPLLWMAVQLMFYCFIRPNEMRFLTIDDVNFQYRYIEINAAYSKNKKTQKVSIPNAFFDQLYSFCRGKSGLIFTNNGNQLNKGYLTKLHKKVLDTLGYQPGKYGFYSWKHTGAVMAVKAGINLKDLQLQLRHHSLDMVNEYLKNLGVLDSQDLRDKFPVL